MLRLAITAVTLGLVFALSLVFALGGLAPAHADTPAPADTPPRPATPAPADTPPRPATPAPSDTPPRTATPAPGDTPPRGVPPALGSEPGAIDALGAADLRDVERAVTAITRTPARQANPDVLFAAARACEDKLLDPARAAAIYARITTDHPMARVATAAARRLDALRALLGDHGEAAGPAAELAQLVAHADDQPAAAVLATATRLTTTN
ncbi:MAG TPA: hypothetical protein VH165_11140, partial [Kofleriaceae bacterium]|nr:hypothetical protein [Kofleriaceae bacterium]